VPASALIPWEWESLLERAGEIVILDAWEEEQWRQAIQAYFYEAEQEEAELAREFLDTLERRRNSDAERIESTPYERIYRCY